MKTLVIIPSRLSASRLPGKPLLKINGLSIISHVYKKAQEANIGEVFVAAEDQEIIEDVKKNGGEAILTNNNHKTGTDRIYEAFVKLGRTDIDLIMNLQGDEPLMNIEDIQKLNKHMIQTKRDLGTLAAKINNKKVFENHNIVKVVTEESLDDTKFPRAINFMRKLNKENNQAYHHLGIYCYNVEILKKFISFKQSQNEIENRLEQLRALDNNINVNVALAKSSPIGVDTKEDFMAIKKIMEYKS
ncbi:3-deoxy-manno-octulosonate cytidylyltransferase [Candidatus Pelagibacter sp.]|uniref:3-deoxy-manno-octulosonate cytidylyltransferase n=1 Tax=Candidatus Pelagibacter sp. TaxID=2024849 RepID=UPI003F849BF6